MPYCYFIHEDGWKIKYHSPKKMKYHSPKKSTLPPQSKKHLQIHCPDPVINTGQSRSQL